MSKTTDFIRDGDMIGECGFMKNSKRNRGNFFHWPVWGRMNLWACYQRLGEHTKESILGQRP